MISISLDPERDNPEVLRRYARRFGAGPGWVFLTGKKTEIEDLRYRLGVYDLDPKIDADITQHSGLLTYGNEPTGRWGALPALLKPRNLAEAVLRTAGPISAASLLPDGTRQPADPAVSRG
jgi:protein SCO1/2